MKKKDQFILGLDRDTRKITSYKTEEDAIMYSIYWRLVISESGYKDAKDQFLEAYEEYQMENN